MSCDELEVLDQISYSLKVNLLSIWLHLFLLWFSVFGCSL